MRTKYPDGSKKNINTRNQLNSAINCIEELGWFFDQKKINLIRILPELLRENINSQVNIVAGQFVSPDPNKHFLIGVLPRLFQDKNLFPTNEDIAEFANSALNLKVSRQEKRSKYELIGLIVCETNNLNEEKLSELVSALSAITGNEDKMKKIIEARKEGTFSWNEAIKNLTSAASND